MTGSLRLPPDRSPAPPSGPSAGRIVAWSTAGLALLGGTALFARGLFAQGPVAQGSVARGGRRKADDAASGDKAAGHVEPVAGHSDHQDWDYGEHGPDTGRGTPSIPPSAQSRDAGHELEDVTTRNIHRIMALFATVALAAVFGMMTLIGVWRSDDRASRPKLTAVQVAPVEVPGPHLQVNAYTDLDHERGREIGKLSGWAYTDSGHTEARIPIEDAMRLVAGRPLDTPGLTRAGSRARPGPNPAITQETPLGTGQGGQPPAEPGAR